MTFDPVFNPSVLIYSLSALTVLFIFFEIKKKHRFQSLRLIAIILLMMSLAGVMLRPTHLVKTSTSILLLTPRYSEKLVDSVLARNPSLTLMHLSGTRPFKNSILLSDADRLGEKIVFVAGEGMPMHLMDRMDSITFQYMPASKPEGVINITHSVQYLKHRENIIRGHYNSRHGKVSLSLHGPAGVEDSVYIHPSGVKPFSLSFVPKQSGRLVLTLIIRDSTQVIQERLPINVLEEKQLSILFLQYYPTFETQYLKSYLAEKKHSMIIRYQLSKNHFRHEFINRESVSFNRLTDRLLSGIDLVIVDEPSLEALSSSERRIVERAVKSGLGLLTLSQIDSKSLQTFFPYKTTAVKKDTATIRLESKSFTLPASRARIAEQVGVVPVLKNQGGILNGFTFFSAGKIGFQLLGETYRLRLVGDSLAYAQIWAPLLEKVARRDEVKSKIRIVTPAPWYENEPIDIKVISRDHRVALSDDSVQIPLREDTKVDNVWHGRTWGGESGWHALQTDAGETMHYYVHERPAWNAMSIANQTRHNNLRQRLNPDTNTQETLNKEEIPPVIFYLLMIIAAGFLWLSPKL